MGGYTKIKYFRCFYTSTIKINNLKYKCQAGILFKGKNVEYGHYVECIKSNNTWILADNTVIITNNKWPRNSFYCKKK